MDFRLRQLQCFLALTERLNYGQAARAQFMSQPTLSFQIKSLEESFGTRLFDRNHNKGIKLTAAGQHLAHSARRIVAEAENAYRHISNLASRLPLRVCCSQVGQLEILPKLVHALAENQPDLRLDIQYTIPEERTQALVSGKLDVLMLVAPIQAAGVTYQLLRRELPVAIVPDIPKYRGRTSISIHEFAMETLLIASEGECSYAKHFAVDLMHTFHLTPAMTETQIQLNFRLAMIAAGKGVSFGSESLLVLTYPGVLFLPFEEALPRTMLGVAWRADDFSESLRLFREALQQLAHRGSEDTEIDELPVHAGLSMESRIAS